MSSSPVAPPVISAVPREPVSLTPGFGRALRGAWLLTWRSQSTLRSLAISLAALLALPLLAYVSAITFGSLSADLFGHPERDVQRLYRRLDRTGVPLSAQGRTDVASIFTDEYRSTRDNWQPPATNAPVADAVRGQLDQLNQWNRRLVSRMEGALDSKQFQRFQVFQTDSLGRKTAEANRPHWSPSDSFYTLLVEFYFFLVLPLVCARSCGALFRDELQAETLGFLLTRPVSRARLVIVKYLSQTAWLMLLLLAQTALLFLAGAIRGVPHLPGVLGIFLVAQFLAVPAWSALGLLFGLFTNRYIAFALVYGCIVELGIGRIPTNINTLSLMRHLKALLANNSDLRDLFTWTTVGVCMPVAALLVATAVFLAASALLFTFREYHVNAEMQK